MSDQILEHESTLENQPKFEHYVAATREIVEEFRDELAKHTAKLHQEAIVFGGQGGDPQEAAELHRLRIACDNFINAMRGELLITNEDVREFADFLARWLERDFAAGRVKTKPQADGPEVKTDDRASVGGPR